MSVARRRAPRGCLLRRKDVFDAVFGFFDRLNDRHGRFTFRLWKRGDWWRVAALLLLQVQGLYWLIAFPMKWVVGILVGLLFLAAIWAYAVIVCVITALPFAALYGLLLPVGVAPFNQASDGDVADPTASGFCSRHACIPSFHEGNGHPVECADGEWSDSGGSQGACSEHGGEAGW